MVASRRFERGRAIPLLREKTCLTRNSYRRTDRGVKDDGASDCSHTASFRLQLNEIRKIRSQGVSVRDVVTERAVTNNSFDVTELVGTNLATRGFSKDNTTAEGAVRPLFCSCICHTVRLRAPSARHGEISSLPSCKNRSTFSPRCPTSKRGQSMSDSSIANIARELAKAMVARAKSRSAEDQKVVLDLQAQLVQEFFNEKENA